MKEKERDGTTENRGNKWKVGTTEEVKVSSCRTKGMPKQEAEDGTVWQEEKGKATEEVNGCGKGGYTGSWSDGQGCKG